MLILFMVVAGWFAGFVDSISGGGGLIALPTIAVVMGMGPDAIGTNKIPGFIAATAALVVYARKGHFNLSQGLVFAGFTGLGSFLGALAGPHVPLEAFRWFLAITCPLILFLVFRKELWLHAPHNRKKSNFFLVAFCGLGCGFYDGVWGPGGGIFMSISLIFVARLPLLNALASAKFANALSAGVALVSYQAQGYVHWREGLIVAGGILFGALVGSNLTVKGADRVVRPVLAVAALLLLARLFV